MLFGDGEASGTRIKTPESFVSTSNVVFLQGRMASLASLLAEIKNTGGSWNWGGATWLGPLLIQAGVARGPREGASREEPGVWNFEPGHTQELAGPFYHTLWLPFRQVWSY